MINKLKQYQDDFDLLISKVSSLKQLAELRSKFLGKKGCVSLMLIEMRSLSDDQKPQAGKHINEFKKNIATLIQEKNTSFRKNKRPNLSQDRRF
jgi:phenylalanyl-tRNA synthetase alpha chain